MALTNFAALTNEQKTIWARDMWKQARDYSFVGKFLGTGPNAVIQRITELRKSEKGTRAVITLVHDLVEDGVAGDTTLEGREEALTQSDQVIRIDQLRHANRIQGRMADQKSVVNFRQESRDVLAYWLADRVDQLAFLTLSGVTYDKKTNGADRVSDLVNLEFAADISAPTSNRYFNWDSSANSLIAGNTATVEDSDTPSYKMLVAMKARAKTQFIRGIKGSGGQEVYHVFMHPEGMRALMQDSDFLQNMRYAGARGESNPLFSGYANSVMCNGMMIHEYRHVYNTSGSSTKWGSGSNIEGQAVLMLGAQALAMADIGDATWEEEMFDYKNSVGISTGKIFGFLKPKFRSVYTNTTEDFGCVRVNTAI